MKSCIDYFCKNGSTVFAAFLDCTKGFDKIDHNGLYLKLMDRNVPLCFLNIMIYWYSNLMAYCKWNGAVSPEFDVVSGVKQGGVLSPKLFALYLDDLIQLLRKSGCGCHIVDLFIAAILYADDLALIAPNRSSLQKLIDICTCYGDYWCIDYNFKKTKVVTFGKNAERFTDTSFTLKGKSIDIVKEWKYLGVTVVSGPRFSCSNRAELKTFYRTSNSVLNVSKKPSEKIMMKILYTICVPTLLYACNVKEYSSSEIADFNTAVNDAIRKIHSFNRWESVRHLRMEHGFESISETFFRQRESFTRKLPLLGNSLILHLSRYMESC